ncbi:MAG: efflux RND transporter periplasmic adaptor subunit [Woeseiaceae bacterium]
MKRLATMLFLVTLSLQATAAQKLTVNTADRPITVGATGIIAPRDPVRFGPPPSRTWQITITKLAREGQRVKEGDVLAEFDGASTDDRLKEKQAELAAKQSELESVLENQARTAEEDKVALAEAESEARKAARKADVDVSVYAGLEYRKLVEDKAIKTQIAEYEAQRVALAKDVRKLEIEELQADIRRLESEVSGAEIELASFTIKAPRAGVVLVGSDRTGAKLDVNDTVNPGMTVVELINDTDLIVAADVPEFAAARLSVGQEALVSLDAAGGSEVKGTVVSVASIVRRQSRFSQAMVRGVEIELTESVEALRPGMSAKVTLTIDKQSDALAVPADAIIYKNGEPGVDVSGQGWTAVELGQTSAGLRIVKDGLTAGAEIQW